MILKKITIYEIEHITHRLAQETMKWDESIPNFDSRFKNVLERCVSQPFQSFSGRQLYKGLVKKSAILFYLMIKNHPFQNGNKRIAMTTLFYFLYKNKKWIKVDNQELYNFAKWVAESNPKFKKQVVESVESFLDTYMIGLKD